MRRILLLRRSGTDAPRPVCRGPHDRRRGRPAAHGSGRRYGIIVEATITALLDGSQGHANVSKGHAHVLYLLRKVTGQLALPNSPKNLIKAAAQAPPHGATHHRAQP
jgi:hypothetical protein